MICLENLKISRIVSESDRLTHNEQPDYRTHEVKIRCIKMGPVQGRGSGAVECSEKKGWSAGALDKNRWSAVIPKRSSKIRHAENRKHHETFLS